MIATATRRKALGQVLVASGLITQEALDALLEAQSRSPTRRLLGEMLIEQGLVSEEQLCEALAECSNVPYAKVCPKICDPRIIEVLPREFIEKHTVLPMFLVKGVLTVAMAEPSNLFLVEEIKHLTGHSVQVVASTARDIAGTMQAHLPSAQVFVIDDFIDDVNPDDFSLVETRAEDIGNLQEAAGHSPVIKLVNYLICQAVRDAASDIHIEPDERKSRVRYRVDGRLY